ncbi:MAG: GNAT family N-acetyltransferase [Anaerolineae bacterium]|nr:GNAT family N-acetyltransferase [Anaerolineae bacterium]
MTAIQFRTTTTLDREPIHTLWESDPAHPHIHLVDMPFRVTSTWQDRDCVAGIWEKAGQVIAYALFQPPWGVLDFAIHPAEQGAALESEVFAWGKAQMTAHAQRSGADFEGVIEFYQDAPQAEHMSAALLALGFLPQDWSVIRFSLDVNRAFPQPQLPEGYCVRPFRGEAEAENYVRLVDAVFGPHWLTREWRLRSLAHPDYLPAIDLVIEHTASQMLVGYCHCWLRQGVGQIEPLGVHPAHHRLGLGTALELAAVAAVRAQGAHTLLVDHGSTNANAIALSHKTGFRQINTAVRYAIQAKKG